MGTEGCIKVLEMIANDMIKTAENFDSRPFNKEMFAECFGHQGAAIATLAKIIKLTLEETRKEK